MLFQLARDLLHPTLAEEKRKCKLKRLVPSPNSYFMDVKCADCMKIQVVFSHAQTPVVCPGCDRILCTPTGGKAKLTSGRYSALLPSNLHVSVYFRLQVQDKESLEEVMSCCTDNLSPNIP
ncbi:40S ribosomal protein S27 [Taenia solium]|eukprot:TsM_000861000 transcript=TsM_000861000 gene=TsM_000861000